MSTPTRVLSGLLLLTSLAATMPATADTAIATRWRAMGEAQRECMAHAQMAIFRAGFDAAAPGSQSMSGKHGDYTASIRCIAEQRIVFFVLSGPSADATSRYLEALYGHF